MPMDASGYGAVAQVAGNVAGAGIATPGFLWKAANAAGRGNVALPELDLYTAKEAEADAIKNGLANFDEASKLVSKTNIFNTEQIMQMLALSSPQAQSLINQQAGITMSELRGEVPQDVQDMIQNSAAGRAVAGGYSGSGFGRNINARDLGLTSLQITSKGFDHAQQWLQGAMSRLGNPMKVQDMFLGPQATWQIGDANYQKQFDYDWMKNQIDYAGKIARDDAWANALIGIGGMIAGSGVGNSVASAAFPQKTQSSSTSDNSAYAMNGNGMGNSLSVRSGDSFGGS